MSDKIVRQDKLEYDKLPDEVKEVLSDSFWEITEKTVSISFDGKQFLCRFPKDIANAIGMKKGDKIKIKIELPHPEIEADEKIEITYIKSE